MLVKLQPVRPLWVVRALLAAGGATVDVGRRPYDVRKPQLVNGPETREVIGATSEEFIS